MPEDISLDRIHCEPAKGFATYSEVAVLIRQAELRKISTKVRAKLYVDREGNPHDFPAKEAAAELLHAELEEWQRRHAEKSTIPLSCCLFNTTEYMNVNYHRERLFIFSALALTTCIGNQNSQPVVKYLRYCLYSAIDIVDQYQALLDRQIVLPLW